MFRHTSFLAASALACGHAWCAPVALNPGLYEMTSETLLPHLEENLRYATTRTRECLQGLDAAALFPLLRHQAFAGCELAGDGAEGEVLLFVLACRNPEAASGAARLSLAADRLQGVLEIKMGGKNMTLSQRIAGPRLGPCSAADAARP